jgi:hypothetical protein
MKFKLSPFIAMIGTFVLSVASVGATASAGKFRQRSLQTYFAGFERLPYSGLRAFAQPRPRILVS